MAELTYDHALTFGREGSSAGERIFVGIQSWWRDEGGLSQQEADRLYLLRSDVVAWLAEQGLVPCDVSDGNGDGNGQPPAA